MTGGDDLNMSVLRKLKFIVDLVWREVITKVNPVNAARLCAHGLQSLQVPGTLLKLDADAFSWFRTVEFFSISTLP